MDTAAGGAAFVAMTAAPSAVFCVVLMDNPILGECGQKKAREERALTTDEMVRAAAVGAVIPIYSWLFKKAKAYLSARRDETGRCLEQRLAYSLGRAWARGYCGAKKALHGLGVKRSTTH